MGRLIDDSREARMKCPGQDTQQWKPGDIFEAPCSNCGRIIEFFKDDTSRRCKGCGVSVPNPKLDFGCAEYCEFADQCLSGVVPEKTNPNAGSAQANDTHEKDDPVTRKEKGV
jgi:hypothetical protein